MGGTWRCFLKVAARAEGLLKVGLAIWEEVLDLPMADRSEAVGFFGCVKKGVHIGW